ncbi:pentapeptide repeat-containing protein [Microbulbifer taiwanensis]|uniref:Pentapeptide repeat-containing protein n=1 Tax=Microbulbifer taiwanensis TaxID=986746 RepID=A0ABW1YPA8_9GAMM|nr:pentapeptide repeat-containing protein [Microbulbifer taiwanensis]
MNLAEKDEYWSDSFEGLDFSCTEIDSKEFDNCTFINCDFSEATFKRCNFSDCEFINCNLSLVKIEYSKFSDVSFRESKLIGINWTKVAWPRLVFSAPIKFYKSIVNDCSFYGLSLPEVVLEECKAHNVDFREGDFSNANFTYTDFTGSFFVKTNLSGADFSEATDYDIDIYQNEIKRAKFSRYEAIRLLDSLDVELVD